MSFINFPAREINCKIVYYGPGLGGKTTNIEYIFRKTNPQARGKLITLDTAADRTLFFDFLPISLGDINGFKTRFFLYTVPGQVYYDATRKLVLRGADGVVFVADSQKERTDANLESLENLEYHLQEHGLDINTIPFVMQYNKRDLPNIEPVEVLHELLNPWGVPEFQAVAPKGYGVFETLKMAVKMVIRDLRKGKMG